MSTATEQYPLTLPEADDAIIHELTTRAVEAIYPSPDALTEALHSGRRLTAYMGIDPTAPDMHVGHESQLLKLARLQQLGHNVILLIGDFTAMIGDPTDKSAARVKLTRETVMSNAEGYLAQASKIISFDGGENPATLAYNSSWLGKMDFADVVELASEFTVQQMLERSMFRKRIDDDKPVGLHEFLYPMMQGWDSVAMGVDIEVGGSDQIFNMLVGSTLVKRHLNKQKYVIAGQLLVDPDGKKIGKTEGNMITLNDTPSDMFHKVMLWGDNITPHALELCTRMPMEDIQQLEQDMQSGAMSGLAAKVLLAKTVVSELHGNDAAVTAEKSYQALATNSPDLDRDSLQQYTAHGGQSIIELLHSAGLASSRTAARKLIDGSAVRINGTTVDGGWQVPLADGDFVIQVGKKRQENYRRVQHTTE